MTRIPINLVGAIGIIKPKDIPAHLLPIEAWSNGQNVRFQDNKAVKFLGHSQVYGTPGVAPYWAMSVPLTGADYWVYGSLAKLYAVDSSSVHTDITRAAGGDYAADATALWNGGVLGNIVIVNNGVDVPQFWVPNPANDMANLTNWPSTLRAKVLKPFKNFLVGINITKSSTNYPHMVKWSHPATPGAVPSSWDETDPTKDAGESELIDSDNGILRDMLQLGDAMILYKDGAVHGMQHAPGSSYIFRIFGISSTTGILCEKAVSLLPDNKGHFLATGDDLVIFDGREFNSVVDKRWRKFLVDNLNQQYFRRSFTVANHFQKSMWFCFPTAGFDRPNVALEYSLVDRSIGVRDLSNISYIAPGRINVGVPSGSWDSDSGSWDSDPSSYDTQETGAFIRRLLACGPVDSKFFRMDDTSQFDGSNFTSYLERTGIAALNLSRDGRPILNYKNRRMITRVYPRMKGEGPINIFIGAHETDTASPVYSNALSFTPGSQEFVDPDPPIPGRLCAIKFQSVNSAAWELEGYDIEVADLGEN